MRVIIFLVLGLFFQSAVSAQPGSLVDRIVYYAKLTAQAKNQGEDAKAEKALLATQESFEEAVRVDGSDPQPHMHMGVFFTNIHRFKESIEQFNIALKKLGQFNPQGTQQIKAQIRKAKLGLYSVKRDKAYDEGKGNITKARLWAEMQLKVSPTPEKIHHDLGTLEMMLCERNASYCATGQENYRLAHEKACRNFAEGFAQYRAQGHKESSGEINTCRKLKCLLSGSWQQHDDWVTLDVLADQLQQVKQDHGSIYIHTTDDIVSTQGKDGVLQISNSPDCSLMLPTSDYYLNLYDNVIAPNQQQGRKPFVDFGAVDTDKPVLSLAQFSGAAFYHWIAEALPRMVTAREHWSRFMEAALIVPSKGATVPGFVHSALKLIMGDVAVSKLKILPYTPRFTFPYGATFVAWSQQPCPVAPGSQEDTERSLSAGCAGLAHPVALQKTRSALHSGLDRTRREEIEELARSGHHNDAPKESLSPYVLVALRGKDVTMRVFDEKVLVDSTVSLVSNYLPAVTTKHSGYGIKLFEAENHTFADAMTLFREAAVVVGVHGGALGNIIACRGQSALLEVGFRTAAARHYQHMASSLGMHYRFVPVDDDDLDRALGAPLVTFDQGNVQKQLLEILKMLDQS